MLLGLVDGVGFWLGWVGLVWFGLVGLVWVGLVWREGRGGEGGEGEGRGARGEGGGGRGEGEKGGEGMGEDDGRRVEGGSCRNVQLATICSSLPCRRVSKVARYVGRFDCLNLLRWYEFFFIVNFE